MLRDLGHQFKPEELFTFIELKPFTRLWSALKLTDDDLLHLQLAIMSDPSGAPVIPGCGGVRKLRFAPVSSDKGKREGLRCCYMFFEEHGVVILAIVYPKSAQEDISADDKKRIRLAVEEIDLELNRP